VELIKLMEDNIIYHIAVYRRPKDFPDDYVARRFNILPGGPEPTDEHFNDPDIAVVRAWIRENYPDVVRMGRMPTDEKHIHEVWM
jgi:hypothetical protein